MKKTMYILGSVEALIGTLLLCLTSILEKSFPLFGRIAFQAAMKGSYAPSDYAVTFPLVTFLGLLLIALGAAQIFFALFKKD